MQTISSRSLTGTPSELTVKVLRDFLTTSPDDARVSVSQTVADRPGELSQFTIIVKERQSND